MNPGNFRKQLEDTLIRKEQDMLSLREQAAVARLETLKSQQEKDKILSELRSEVEQLQKIIQSEQSHKARIENASEKKVRELDEKIGP